jgi:tRNA pseudouridine55 synthase
VLNVYKASGPTSHDVVARARRLLGIRRVGHSGTLDPMADGVLLIAVGAATRLVEYLTELPKTYRAVARFGLTTDTQDITGTPVSEQDASVLTRAAIERAVGQFTGWIVQTPPMFSALKVAGRPLYERARRGEEIERVARPVLIRRLEILDFRPGPAAEASFEVECSSGTYVRTLCHDLGAALGAGATLARLTRTAIGPFTLQAATPPERLEELQQAGIPLPWIAPAQAVAHLPSLTVSAEQAVALRHGRRIAAVSRPAAPVVRLLDLHGSLVATGRCLPQEVQDGDTIAVAPEKVFPPADDE